MFKFLLRTILTMTIIVYFYKKFFKKKRLRLAENTQQSKDEQS